MLKNLTIISLTVLSLIFMAGCDMWPFCGGDDNDVGEERKIEDFSTISLNEEDTHINLVQGDKISCKVNCSRNTIGFLKTIVSDKILNINLSGCPYNHKEIKIDLTCKNLNGINHSENGTVMMKSQLKTDNLAITVSGSGKINIEELYANNIKVIISGSGNVNLGGVETIKKIEIEISGSGSLNAYNLHVENATVLISGSGSCRLNTKTWLSADISGSGNVYYQGSPQTALNISGSGRAVKLN